MLTNAKLTTEDAVTTQTAPTPTEAFPVPAERASTETDSNATVSLI